MQPFFSALSLKVSTSKLHFISVVLLTNVCASAFPLTAASRHSPTPVSVCAACAVDAMVPAPAVSVRGSKTIIVEGHRDAGEASVSTRAMKYLPFKVPKGVAQITIHREYDNGGNPTRKNTVDFGLFDDRGTKNGFRGWQGGSPGDFVITGNAATCSPHAVPGPLPAGRWSIAQYYLVSAPTGLNYKYTITFSTEGTKPPATFSAPPAYAPGVIKTGPGWYAGNLHAHSLHSDGGRTFLDLIGYCGVAGFDFMVSSEHNTFTSQFRFPEAAQAHPNVLLLYGDEFTSPGGHANITGPEPGRWFDFRMDPGDGKLPGTIQEAHRQGALFTVNHPFAPCTSCTWVYPPTEWEQADAIEVWNGAWTTDDRRATDLWDYLLKSGRHIRAFGGTDYHRTDNALVPAACVYADSLSTPAIMDGLRRGHVILSESPKGPKVFLQPTDSDGKTAAVLPGDTIPAPQTGEPLHLSAHVTGGNGLFLRVVWAFGETVLPVTGDDITVPVTIPPKGDRPLVYVRTELLRGSEKPDEAAMAALTNPLYVGRGEG